MELTLRLVGVKLMDWKSKFLMNKKIESLMNNTDNKLKWIWGPKRETSKEIKYQRKVAVDVKKISRQVEYVINLVETGAMEQQFQYYIKKYMIELSILMNMTIVSEPSVKVPIAVNA